MSRSLVKKFLNNQTTPEETREILDWFKTEEGSDYLKRKLDEDIKKQDQNDIRHLVPELDSEKLYYSILKNTKRSKSNILHLKRGWYGFALKTAAVILVIVASSLFAITYQHNITDQSNDAMAVVFKSGSDDHRQITLRDGSSVRLNSNTELKVKENFMTNSREVDLIGEAYFEIVHNSELPFIIHANEATVEVLGTSFNVRSNPDESSVQVAVLDGKVSLRSVDIDNGKELSVVLSKGQYLFLDLLDRTTSVDEVAVDNYLAWKKGVIIFEDVNLRDACKQLGRLYDFTCDFENKMIENLMLTARFPNKSIEQAAEIISMTLDLNYEIEEDKIAWSNK